MNSLLSRVRPAALVLVVLPLLFGLAQLTRPSGGHAARPAGGGTMAIQSTVAACPSVGGTRVGLLSPGAGSGRTQIAPVPTGAALTGPAASGVAWAATPSTGGALVVHAEGGSAAGLELEQTSRDKQGLAAARCGSPGTDAWFLGPGPADGDQITLTLTNVDDQPANVSVQALSDIGPMVTTGGMATNVPAESSVQIVLGQGEAGLAPIVNNAQLLGLHVQTASGRVVPAVHVRAKGAANGVDWVPQTAPAGTSLVIPAVPGGNGERRLLLSVPGTKDAKVAIQVVTAAGIAPQGGPETLDAAAQTTTQVPLEALLSGQPAAVLIQSDQPVLAGLTVARQAAKSADIAYSAAVSALGTGGGVVADLGPAGTAGSLVLSAPGAAAKVRLVLVTAAGRRPAPQQVQIGAGRTVSVKLTAPAGVSGLLVLPEQGSGPVYAGRVLTAAGPLISILPLQPAPTTVQVPAVRGTLTVAQSPS